MWREISQPHSDKHHMTQVAWCIYSSQIPCIRGHVGGLEKETGQMGVTDLGLSYCCEKTP